MAGFLIVLGISMISYIAINDPDSVGVDDLETARKLLGTTSVLILVVFYASPLANLYQIIKKKDATSLSLPLAIACGINGVLWTSYGFAIKDPV